MPRGTQGSVCPFRPPAPPKPIPRCLEQHRSVILHDSCDPEWSQRPHFLDSLKPHADVGLIAENSGLSAIASRTDALVITTQTKYGVFPFGRPQFFSLSRVTTSSIPWIRTPRSH